jgi:GNAT superfamily N-acetyltransferase
MIRLLKKSEYPIWIEIAEEVEVLFGPMVQIKEFQEGIKESIKNNDAYCSTNDVGVITGIVSVDRTNNEISWLAVRKQYRGNNIGKDLVRKAIDELKRSGNIYVTTFASGVDVGKSARHIYENNGFIDRKPAGKNPAGIETVLMVKNFVHERFF